MPRTDANKTCSEVQLNLAKTICKLDLDADRLRLACQRMDWDDEPVYDMQDAMRNAGLALAKLVWWEKEEEDGHGDA